MSHDNEDMLFIRSVPQGILQDFRQHVHPDLYVEEHWQKFLALDWVVQDNKTEELKAFLQKKQVEPNVLDASFVRHIHPGSVEDLSREVCPEAHLGRLVTLSQEETCVDRLPLPDLATGITHETTVHEQRMEASGTVNYLDFYPADNDVDMTDCEEDQPTQSYRSTAWLDPDVTSTVSFYPHKLEVNRQLSVDETEVIIGLPSYYPVPRTNRIYILDLSDAKYQVRDQNNQSIPLDALVKDKDQDSWRGGTGKGDSKVTLHIFGDVKCRRSRMDCSGVWACEKLAPKLIGDPRYELNPASLQELVDIQVESRHKEVDLAEKVAILFFAVCQTRTCPAKDSHGRPCPGQPIIKINQTGKRPYIGCSEFSKEVFVGHRSDIIPDNVNLQHLATLFSGAALGGMDDHPTCTHVVPAHIGGRVKKCKIPHNSDGNLSALKRHPCPAHRTIYVPLDPTIRKIAIYYDYTKPHNHPVLPATKTSREVRELYRQCISALGLAGCTVQAIEIAPSTKLLLGKTPSMLAPALQDRATKQRMLNKAKKKAFPFGVGIEGVTHLQSEDIKKLALEERYIHIIKKTISGADIVFTANPYLLSRIHKATTIEVDTTFNRIDGDLKEWEVVMWDPEIRRALTVARVYTNRADTATYKMIFDELQAATLQLTGKPLLLKALSQGGNLLSIGVDLELAQALGAGQSFLPTNEPAYSGIPATVTAEELIPYFVRGCLVHVKRGINALKDWVSEADFERLMGLPYLGSQEELDAFDAWIINMGNAKVTAWWKHKVNNSWIIPAIVKFKSKIKPEDWDRTPPTTNLNEGQHQHTKSNTGAHLSLLEGIIRVRELDEQTAAEVRQSLAAGVLKNRQNDSYTRGLRSLTRARKTTRKSHEAREEGAALTSLQEQITSLTQTRKDSSTKIKELRELARTMASANHRRGRRTKLYKAESSSSGKTRLSLSRKATARRPKKVATIIQTTAVDSNTHALDGAFVIDQPASAPSVSIPRGSRKRPRAPEVDVRHILGNNVHRTRSLPKRFKL